MARGLTREGQTYELTRVSSWLRTYPSLIVGSSLCISRQQSGLDAVGCRYGVVVLPDDDEHPSGFGKPVGRIHIALPGRRNLRTPPLSVCFWQG